MTRYALVDNATKKVTNVIHWEGAEWLPPRNHHVVYHEQAGIGDVYDEENMKFIRTHEDGRVLEFPYKKPTA
jgi:hypothetical protein